MLADARFGNAEAVLVKTHRVRLGGPGDRPRVYELLFDAPRPESIAIAGGLAQARALGPLIALVQELLRGSQTFVYEIGTDVVAMLQTRAGRREVGRTLVPLLRAAQHVLRVYGIVNVPGVLRRIHARARLEFPPVQGAYHLTQLAVDPRVRGRGIGAALLRHAEADARRRGFPRMSLTTGSANPACKLFEREGFRIVAQRTDAEFTALTASVGRLLMVKELDTQGPGLGD